MARIPLEMWKQVYDTESNKDINRSKMIDSIATNLANSIATKKALALQEKRDAQTLRSNIFKEGTSTDKTKMAMVKDASGVERPATAQEIADYISGKQQIPLTFGGVKDQEDKLKLAQEMADLEKNESKTAQNIEEVGMTPELEAKMKYYSDTRKVKGWGESPYAYPKGYKGKPKAGGAGLMGDINLGEVSEDDKRLAWKMVEGQMSPRMLSNRGGVRDRYLKIADEMAYEKNVPFSADLSEARASVRKDFTSGKESNNVKSLNTAIAHVNKLQKAVDELEPGNFPLLNKIAISGQKFLGDPRISKVMIVVNGVSGESATLFKGTSGTDQEIKEWRESLKENMSKEQWNASIQELMGLVEGRMDAIRSKWDNAMLGTGVPLKLLNENSRNILNSYNINTSMYDDKSVGEQKKESKSSDTRGIFEDAQGNKAYKNPDGSYEEIPR